MKSLNKETSHHLRFKLKGKTEAKAWRKTFKKLGEEVLVKLWTKHLVPLDGRFRTLERIPLQPK